MVNLLLAPRRYMVPKVKCKRNGVGLLLSSLSLLLLVAGSCSAQSVNATSDPETTPSQLCPVCLDGEPMPLPEKPLSLGDLPFTTCADLASYTAQLVGGTEECTYFQLLGPYCGCAKPSNACSFCPSGHPVTHKDAKVDLLWGLSSSGAFDAFFGPISCEIAESFVGSNVGTLFDAREPVFCIFMQFRSNLCGCKPDWKQILAQWSFRLSGTLSLLCSTLIIADVLRKRSQRFTMYNQLVLGISFFDCISSVAYVLATVMTPIDVGLYQAKGNATSCTAQGVLALLGQTSIFYNMLLSIYFWLVICRNWKEHQFRKLRLWIHLVVCSIGVAVALSAMPYFGPTLTGCGILIPPATATFWPATILYTIRLCLVAVVISVATAATCVGVYRQQKKAQRWMADRNMELSRKVFWQSFWYVLAFWLTIPWVIVAFYVEFRSSTHLLVHYISLGLVGPSQGLLNSLVYFRRHRAKGRSLLCFGCGGTPIKTQTPGAPICRSGGRTGDTNDQSLGGVTPDNVATRNNGEKPSETEGHENEDTSDDGVFGDNHPFSGTENHIAVESLEGVRGGEPHHTVEFSAVAEYWKLNEGPVSY